MDTLLPVLEISASSTPSRSSCSMLTPSTYISLGRRVSFPAWPIPSVVFSKTALSLSTSAVFSVPVPAVSVQKGWSVSASRQTLGHTSSLLVPLREEMLH